MFLDSAAKNYPEILRDQNKYATFDILAYPSVLWLQYGDCTKMVFRLVDEVSEENICVE